MWAGLADECDGNAPPPKRCRQDEAVMQHDDEAVQQQAGRLQVTMPSMPKRTGATGFGAGANSVRKGWGEHTARASGRYL